MKQSEYFQTQKLKDQLASVRPLAMEAMRKVKKEKAKLLRDEYAKNPKFCPECNKQLDYGKPKFCNSSCAAKFSNKNRGPRSDETRKRIASSVTKSNLIKYPNKKNPEEFVNVTCQICNTIFTKKITSHQKMCSDSCRKQHQKNWVQQKIAAGTFSGWKSRTKLEPSYPEKYFIEVLNDLNVAYQREHKIGTFFADFLISEKLVLEIDGHQHKMPDRQEIDQRKDKFLIENGYKVFRIEWFNPTNEDRKAKLYTQINTFKEWLVENAINLGDEFSCQNT